MFSPLLQRVAAALSALSLAIGLAAGPVHLHSHEHAHVGHDGQVVLHTHAHDSGHHAGHHHEGDESQHQHTDGCEHAPGSPCEHNEDDCNICHFLGQAAVVLTVDLDTAEAPCFDRVPQSSSQCESALPLRLTLSRGPPPRDA